ncbi:MAG: aminoglycoside phosphotransferase family protein [Tabrizicola sp.]
MDLAQALARFRLSDPIPLARTATSTLWTVTQPEGDTAVLKLLHPGQTEEARGAAYLQALAGQGAVTVHALHGPAILMEHCPGPSLGDLARSGRDDEATNILCDVIQTLHAARPDPARLEPLASRFAPLTEATLTGDLAQAAQLARTLIADPVPPVALHGDLHHDNVLNSPRGWLAIDPKGVWGDPAYEPANAFRNPEGLGKRLFDPDRLNRMAAQVSRGLGLPPDRLLAWAAAHCALSTRWSLEDGKDMAEDIRLLPLLLTAHAAL